jgi:site-specific recombinase XerD
MFTMPVGGNWTAPRWISPDRQDNRLADAGVDVVKIWELMGHASIVTTMRHMHVTDKGKRGAITVLSEYRQQHCRKFVTNEKPQVLQPAANH